MLGRRWLASVAALSVVLTALVPLGATAASAADNAVLQLKKSLVGEQTVFAPGDTFEYEIVVGCSSTLDLGCLDAALTDALPEPLVLNPANPEPVTASVAPGGTADVVLDGTTGFTVTPQQQDADGNTGLLAGGTMTVTVNVQVPADTSGEFNGAKITNTAKADAGNAAEVQSSADITLRVDTTLAASISKRVSPATVPAVPGRAVEWTIAPGNASNQTVDTIVMQDPTAPPFTFAPNLELVGVDVTEPAGATGHEVQYWVTGTWTNAPPNPIGSAGGVRVTFTGSFKPGATGEVKLRTQTTDAVAGIPEGGSVEAANTAQATVEKNGEASEPVTADAKTTISASGPDATITKTFDDSTLVAGQSTVATITATNGAQNVQRLTVTEPSAGKPGLVAQGLEFTGFGEALAWPVAASSATITYRYTDCAETSERTTRVDSLPAAQSGCTVDGFTIVFEADGDGIQPEAYAALPLRVAALPVTTTAELHSTNFVDTQVENELGQTGSAQTDASFTVKPLVVGTEASKRITPADIYGVPGTRANVALSGKVSDDSTVGSTELVLTDPVDPATDGDFWNAFAPARIHDTDIPNCVALSVSIWSRADGAWKPLAGATDVQGAQAKWGVDIPASVRADAGGIRFAYRPTCESTLPPGFTALVNLDVEVIAAHSGRETFTNTVQSSVHNDDAVEPDATDTAEAPLGVHPLDGTGPDLVDKHWLDGTVPALSGEERTARIGWSTQGLKLTDMTITDPASPGELSDIATSVYDAFDLVRIAPVTPASDPLIANDRITAVFRYSASASDWVDITSAACANGCEGRFGGYSLLPAEQSDTLGIRVTYSERVAEAGVGASYDRRPLDLVFRIRDTLRSDPSAYALGTFHEYGYNTGEPGLVHNSVAAHGVNTATGIDRTSTDGDRITIIDSPLNVSLQKEFDQSQLGLPQPGTDPADYPLISAKLTASNDSAVRIASMRISDPASAQAQPTAFDTLNLFSIDGVTAPAGLAAADARIVLTRGATADAPITVAAAQALAPSDLADVTGVEVVFAKSDGSPVIEPAATGVLDLTWQLRAEKRSGGAVGITPAGESILNEAHAAIDSPGRIACPADGCSTGEATADDEFRVVEADYAIRTKKTIAPGTVPENGSTSYRTTLTGQPLGSARTTLLTLTDATPTFWNTMEYTGVSIQVPRPVNQLRMDVLIGVDFELQGGALVAVCDGVPVDASSDCWKTGDWVDVQPGSTAQLDLPAGVPAGDVVGVRFSARDLENGAPAQWERPFNPTLNYELQTERLEYLRSEPMRRVSTTRPGLDPNPGETERGVISDTVIADGTAQFGADQRFTDQKTDTATTTVTHLTNAIRVTKTRGTNPLVSPSATIPYVITVANTGQWDMTGFRVSDRIGLIDGRSPLVEPTPAAYDFAVSGPGAPSGATGFSASLDESTGILDIVNADPGFVFKAGWTLTVKTPLKFRAGVSPDVTIDNRVSATSDRLFDTCQSTTTDLKPNPDTHEVATCAAETEIGARASASVALKKWVKGDGAGDPATGADDLGVLNVLGDGTECDPSTPGLTDRGFTSYPCAPITRPGGLATWRLDFQNTGNANARVIAAVDTLPDVSDQGVIVSSGRGSQFHVTLAGTAGSNLGELADAADGQFELFGSTSVQSQTCNQNAIEHFTEGAVVDPACGFDWQPLAAGMDETQLSSIRSLLVVLRFDDPTRATKPGLRPGETLRLEFDTRTPWVLPVESAVADGLPVAYNSFAGASRSVSTATQPERSELVLEPQRVGIATVTAQLQLRKAVERGGFPAGVELPAAFSLRADCVSGTAPVALLASNGDDASRTTVPGDGTPVFVNAETGPVNLPLFAKCGITEDPAPAGATVSVDPADGVVAERDLSQNASVWNPYRGETERSAVTVTNTYTTGGFTVRKVADMGGAVDQDGTPIGTAQRFAFAASCDYLGQEVLPQAQRGFELQAGETRTITGIPTDANCRVTETDTGTAVGTSTTVTGDSAEPRTEAGEIARFRVVSGTTPQVAVEFVNRFTTGTLSITKELTGAGAERWGDGPFTVRVVCTLAGALPETVYDGGVQVSRAAPTATVEHLPTGAECTVTETDPGVATEHTTDPAGGRVTIGDDADDPVAAVTVVNEFRTGAFDVLKEVAGPGSPTFSDGPFDFGYACTFGGERIADGTLTLRGDGSGDPLRSEAVRGLPVGAECAIAETGTGGADETPAPVSITIPDEQEGAESVVTAGFLNEFSAGTMTVEKRLDGPGAELPSARDAQFTILATCQAERDGTLVTLHEASLRIRGGQTLPVADANGDPVQLPFGAHCFIRETDRGGASASTVSHGDYVNAAVIARSDASQTLALVATNTFELPAPKPGGTGGANGIAVTGAPLGTLLGTAGAAALIALLGGVLLLRRRRS
ncbi:MULTISPECIES: DUF5979 domain-containing protein [unclassified Leucobacter]|uniref:DUF5979 domain-containing protein n=1 Tax=unclassified Leucobacter TaxID=2621730 RepID=UPI0030185FB8